MRNEQTMRDLILTVAQSDQRVRAVYMNGSRANPRAKHDLFQDYDIVYVVTDINGMLADRSWYGQFGTPLLTQEPDALDEAVGQPCDPEQNGYTIMSVFTDGNRIDLHLEPVTVCELTYGSHSQTVPLLDKDGILPQLPAASDKDRWVQRPSAELFYHHTNDFWWVAPYVAKGLWRNELLYANAMLGDVLRPHLLDMCDWLVGSDADWQISTGKLHKDLVHLLPEELWVPLTKTFANGDNEATWQALSTTMELFATVAQLVAQRLNFDYQLSEEQASRQYIAAIRDLPAGATTMKLKWGVRTK
ncbi:aminoglycoside 6-adenylyltransferase [Lacticaseibacillus zhaodongensis]|uniref:aminoglycoside 6-adenylyltransferase n=1 Tax=Lacticaseibacillus zhaodongensis TaxID=2668065 RepID=UPI0018AFD0EE|nr:aminoglycoside 6-adenylyltransferase [Lacticaseibacillus zhaodongensis]